MCGRYARFTPQHLYASLFGARDMGTLGPPTTSLRLRPSSSPATPN